MPRISQEDSVLYEAMKHKLIIECCLDAGTIQHHNQKTVSGINSGYYGTKTFIMLWTHILTTGQQVVNLPMWVIDEILNKELDTNLVNKARLDVVVARKGEHGQIALSRINTLLSKSTTTFPDGRTTTFNAPEPGSNGGALFIPRYTVPGTRIETFRYGAIPVCTTLLEEGRA